MEANLNTTPVSPVANRNLTKSPESPSILNRSDASLNEADEYFTEPTLDELERSMRDGKVQIKNGLTVGRKGYGSVYWPGSFELSSLDFENMVFFRSKEVTVYPDENTKPPIGIDLNRPAEISLQGVWPFDKVTKQFIKDPVAMGKLRFRNRLELVCERMDAKFIDYQVKTGTWTFSVSHFSKYGLIDEDEEISPEDLNAILKQQKQMLKVQRASIPKKGPLKEIQSTFFENSTFPTGLGGNLDAPKVKVEMVEYDVDMSDLLFQSTAKRIRQDPLIPDVLDSKFFPTSKDISYVRRKLVQRPVVNNDVISIKNNQELQYYLRKTHGFTPTIFQNNPRLQWHPSNSETLIKADRFQRRVNLYKIHLVPMLRDYFLNILTSDGRAAELDAIAETDSLKFSPPSVLLQLLDSYLLTMKKNRRLDQARVDAEIDQLLRALLVSPSSMDYKIQQRNRFSAWIKSKLQSNLKEILDKYSMEDQSDASRVIFECLIHGSVKDAIDVALKFKLYNLSLVLSLYQCPNSMQCKDNFAAQHYESERIFKHCNDEYFMKIYQLLAGPKTSKGMQRPDGFFDCLKGLSWFQIIGVFLWYASSPSDGLVEWSKFYKELASTGHVSEVL
uniref:Nuclear pore complex protein Nup98-Nup96 n=1 Tax=Panagrolaimus sp. JU765 TaxID=591449 RepID=A0AC34QFV6_9BILA